MQDFPISFSMTMTVLANEATTALLHVKVG